MEDEDIAAVESPREARRLNRWLIVALLAAVAAGVLLASSVWTNQWSSENAVGNEMVEETGPVPEDWCAAQSTYDGIRRELFRRAAQVRGSDHQAYTRLADFALLRVNAPVVRSIDERIRSISCNGTASLDLPPGVAAAGGRRSLSGDIDYVVQPAADGSGNVVRLGNADSIVIPLAALTRTGAAQSAPLVPPDLDEPVTVEPFPTEGDDGAPGDPGDDSPAASANPSFDCGRARTRGEIAVCNDPGLAALDRQMAAQFNAALTRADRSQRRLLERTRGRFLSYRDRCASNQCVAETYRSRMREIGDIMENRWRG